MTDKFKEEELLEYLEIWKDAFKKAVKKSKLLSMMKKDVQQIELMRIEQAYQQIKERIKDYAEHQELTANYIDIVIDLYDQLEKKRPKMTEEWYGEKAKKLITMVSNLYPHEGSSCVIPKSKAKDFIRSLMEGIPAKKPTVDEEFVEKWKKELETDLLPYSVLTDIDKKKIKQMLKEADVRVVGK